MEVLRSYLHLQEQLRSLQLALDEKSKETDAAAARNAQSVAGRLPALEQTLATERARDLDAVHSANRLMLIVSVAFTLVGLLAVGLMAYQWRTMSHLAEAATQAPYRQALAAGSDRSGLGERDVRLLGQGSAEESNARLLEAMERLEKRIHELDHADAPRLSLQPSVESSANSSTEPAAGKVAVDAGETGAATNGGRITLLLGKGQSLLSLDKVEEAVVCFDEALSLHPGHTDALIKKAMALERLRKLPEAIECYDRAIASDKSLTIAYLYKGGLYNRMERFGEALECYEQALRTQEKGG